MINFILWVINFILWIYNSFWYIIGVPAMFLLVGCSSEPVHKENTLIVLPAEVEAERVYKKINLDWNKYETFPEIPKGK